MICDCCGKTTDGHGDIYPQPDSRVFCGNCDGAEEPECCGCRRRRARGWS